MQAVLQTARPLLCGVETFGQRVRCARLDDDHQGTAVLQASLETDGWLGGLAESSGTLTVCTRAGLRNAACQIFTFS